MVRQRLSKSLTLAVFLVSSPLYAASQPAVEAKNGMVVTSQYLASQVGIDILKMGGMRSMRRWLSVTLRPWLTPAVAISVGEAL